MQIMLEIFKIFELFQLFKIKRKNIIESLKPLEFV